MVAEREREGIVEHACCRTLDGESTSTVLQMSEEPSPTCLRSTHLSTLSGFDGARLTSSEHLPSSSLP